MTPFILLALLVLPCLAAPELAELLHFKANGFSIAPLDEASDATIYQPVSMYLPVTEAFAPNVNVQIQLFKGTIKEYADLSKKQFMASKFILIAEKNTDAFVTFEFSGEVNDQKLHFYSKAEAGGERFTSSLRPPNSRNGKRLRQS